VEARIIKTSGYARSAMTAGELIRSARSRAGLSQAELAARLGLPRSQIGRWEGDEVDPGFATVRRVLRACGFDIAMGLVPYAPNERQEARLAELHRLTPKERLDAALTRAGLEEKGYRLDPYAILTVLEEHRVDYILIGSLARVIQGADEIPNGLDLTLSRRAESTEDALKVLGAITAPRQAFGSHQVTVYWSPVGVIKSVGKPSGTSGYDDLRRKADRVDLGQGLRPRVATPGDLVRMLEADRRADDVARLEALRRLVELHRGLGSKLGPGPRRSRPGS
jgi:transcriptional regulator with XRE-family HTH domain